MEIHDFRKLLATSAGRAQLGLDLTADEAAEILADDELLQGAFQAFKDRHSTGLDLHAALTPPSRDALARPRFRHWWVWGSAAALLVIAAACIATVTIASARAHPAATVRHYPSPRPTPTADPFTANGTVTVPADAVAMVEASPDRKVALGGPCITQSGYSDFSEGAQVLITNASDQKVAVGVLGAPVVVQGATARVVDAQCQFTFAVYDVPGGQGLYSVHVGNTFRGEQTYSQGELYIGVTLTLH